MEAAWRWPNWCLPPLMTAPLTSLKYMLLKTPKSIPDSCLLLPGLSRAGDTPQQSAPTHWRRRRAGANSRKIPAHLTSIICSRNSTDETQFQQAPHSPSRSKEMLSLEAMTTAQCLTMRSWTLNVYSIVLLMYAEVTPIEFHACVS